MMKGLATAAAALLITGSVQAALPVQLTKADLSAPRAAVRPPLRPRRAQERVFNATFTGNFFDLSGKRYEAMGRGDFWFVAGEGSPPSLKYSVTMTAVPTSHPHDPIELGQMVGEGPMDSSRAPELIAFSIRGERNERGNSLDVDGIISGGHIEGIFRLSADVGGAGQGNFLGH